MPTWFATFTSRMLGWLRSASQDKEFSTEIQTHLEMLTEDNIAHGMSPEEATRDARVRLGGITQLMEEQRDRRGFPLLDALWQDARYALRVFGRSPGFTLVGVLTIAIGVGVNTTVFTLLDAIAFKRLPVADAAHLLRFARSFESGARGDVQYAFSFEEFSYYRAHSARLESLIAAGWPETVVSTPDAGDTMQAQVVSGNYFAVLGVNAALGRTFLPEEDEVPGGAPVVVLSDSFWRRRMQGDPGVVGRTISANGTAFTVIGVAPATFIGTGNPPQVPDFWAPLMMQGALTPGAPWLDRPQIHRLQLLARVRADTSIVEARAELEVLESQLTEHVETHTKGDRTISLALQPAAYFGGTDDLRFAALVALLMATVLDDPVRRLREPGEHAARARCCPAQRNWNASRARRKPRPDRPSASDREPAPRNRWWTRRPPPFVLGQPPVMEHHRRPRPDHVSQRPAIRGLAHARRTDTRLHSYALSRYRAAVRPFARLENLAVRSHRLSQRGIVRRRRPLPRSPIVADWRPDGDLDGISRHAPVCF